MDYAAKHSTTHVVVVGTLKALSGGVRFQAVEKIETTENVIQRTDAYTDATKFLPFFLRFPTKPNAQYRFDFEGNGQWNSGAIDDVRVYSITAAEHDAIPSMTADQVAAKYPYVDGMTNVVNPYVDITGANLLPPFAEWEFSSATVGNTDITAPYEIELSPKQTNAYFRAGVDVLPNTTYTISADHTGKIAVDDGGTTLIVDYSSAKSISFNSGAYSRVFVYFSNGKAEVYDCTFKNPMLVVGSESKPFRPQQRYMWAVETQLAAHPRDGSNPDVLYTGDDGLPYVVEKWAKVSVDDASIVVMPPIGNMHTGVGFKSLPMQWVDEHMPFGADVGFAVKYDGTPLKYNGAASSGTFTSGDLFFINGKDIRITAYNVDTGWGQDYTPSHDEFKVFLRGWRMYNSDSAGMPPYNGTGTKHWVSMDGSVWGRPVGDPALNSLAPNYTPYRIQYLRSATVMSPVKTHETGATLTPGANTIKVGSGVVIREKANTVYSIGEYRDLNNVNNPASLLSHKVDEFKAIYRGSALDMPNWVIRDNSGYGKYRAAVKVADYDPTAIYRVTYTMLDPTLAATVNVKAEANMRGTVSALVDHVGDVERRLSAVEGTKADDEAPLWVRATVLNGWYPYDGVRYSSGEYYKDSTGTVHLAGMLAGGVMNAGTPLFVLPKGYRPTYHNIYIAACSDGGAIISPAAVAVSPDGTVSVNRAPQNGYLSIAGITFRAEQ